MQQDDELAGHPDSCWKKSWNKQPTSNGVILLMEEILHQLIGCLSHYLQGFIHPRWCRISSINSRSLFGTKHIFHAALWNEFHTCLQAKHSIFNHMQHVSLWCWAAFATKVHWPVAAKTPHESETPILTMFFCCFSWMTPKWLHKINSGISPFPCIKKWLAPEFLRIVVDPNMSWSLVWQNNWKLKMLKAS